MRYYLLILALLLSGCTYSARVPDLPELKPGILPHVDPGWANGLDALFLYSYGFCVVIIAACIAILVWVPLPSLRKWALMGLTFAGALIGMGVTFSIVKPFIPWIVLGGVGLGAAIGVWYVIANFDALKQVIHKGPSKEDLTVGAQKLVTACQNLIPTK